MGLHTFSDTTENEVNYLHLISQCPSEEWRNAMMDRYKNWKKTNSKEK